MAGSLSNGRPYIKEYTGVQTIPEYKEYVDATFTTVQAQVRLEVSGITEDQLKKLVNLYLLADDGSINSQVRYIIGVEVVPGTPDTYFVIIDEPFANELGEGDLPLEYVDPNDAQLTNTISAGIRAINVDGVANVIKIGESVMFQPCEPFKPLVLLCSDPYRVSNGLIISKYVPS